jgi:hypothetical protein
MMAKMRSRIVERLSGRLMRGAVGFWIIKLAVLGPSSLRVAGRWGRFQGARCPGRSARGTFRIGPLPPMSRTPNSRPAQAIPIR